MKNNNKNIKLKKTTTNKENVISRGKRTQCTRKKRKNIIHEISLLKDNVK